MIDIPAFPLGSLFSTAGQSSWWCLRTFHLEEEVAIWHLYRYKAFKCGLAMCCRHTWVLCGYDGLLLENISHVAIERPFRRAAGLRAQIVQRVYVCGWEDAGVPACWCTEIHVIKRSINHLSCTSYNWSMINEHFSPCWYQWTVCCVLIGRLNFKVEVEYHNELLQKLPTYSFTVNSTMSASLHVQMIQPVIRNQNRRHKVQNYVPSIENWMWCVPLKY